MTWFDDLTRAVREQRPVTLITVLASERGGDDVGNKLIQVDGEAPRGELATDRWIEALLPLIGAGSSRTERVVVDGQTVEVFVEVVLPPPELFVVGAVHVAVHLIHFAKRLGFRCVVLDARAAFATKERFPHVDDLVVGWPADELERRKLGTNSYCVFLTHDPKQDDPALRVALEAGSRYIGALGSKRTHAKRIAALKDLGVDEASIGRIAAPIGLDLGGRRPEEIALSIAAQLQHARYNPGQYSSP